MSTTCDIRVQAWGRSAVLVCLTCGDPDTAGLLLVRAEDSGGLSDFEVTDRSAKHRENMRRENADAVAGTPVPEALDLGPEETTDLIAYGDPDEHPAGYHPRTGQRLSDVCMIPDCGCTGEAHP